MTEKRHKYVYFDESMEKGRWFVPALAVDTQDWHATLEHLVEARRRLHREFGMYVRKEIHTTDFLNGRGNYFEREVGKAERTEIFIEHLEHCLSCKHIRVFTLTCDQKKLDWGFQRLLTRMQTTFRNPENPVFPGEDSTFSIFMDEGKDAFFRSLTRELRRYNPTPGSYTGFRNVPLTRMLEDPVMLESGNSLFVQLADMVAYSLLAHYRPRPAKLEPINSVFANTVGPYCVTVTSRSNEFGIVEVD